MNIDTASPTSQHHLARLIAWARLMLAWIGAVLFSTAPPRVSRRRIRRRYALLDLERMAHMVACLILIRACARARRPRQPPRAARNHARCGFAKRMRPRSLVRSAIGGALRRKLRHRDLGARLVLLADALAHLDAHARMLLPRLNRRFTRLAPILPIRPPHDVARRIAPLRAPCPADTS